MPRRKDSFAAALADAQKRLDKAKTERQLARQRIMALDVEIPRLEQIVASLSPKRVKEVRDDMLHSSANPDSSDLVRPDGGSTRSEVPMTPDTAKKIAQRATGPIRGGSIPYGGTKPAVAAPTSEDETLPDPEGEEII